MIELVPIVRPNGKIYRPRDVKAHAWRDEDDDRCGVVIIGTHDLERAQAFADRAVKYWFDSDLIATKPEPGWYRSGYDWRGECWISDPVRGGAGISFTADYGPESSS